MASEIEVATLVASIVAALRRRDEEMRADGTVALGLEGALPDGAFPAGRQIRMHFRGLHTIVAAEVGQWIELLDAYPRTKLFIQNRGTGASPNVGNVFYADKQQPTTTQGIRILPDGHLWDDVGCHQGKVWILGNTVNTVIAMAEWGVAEVVG